MNIVHGRRHASKVGVMNWRHVRAHSRVFMANDVHALRKSLVYPLLKLIHLVEMQALGLLLFSYLINYLGR